MRTRNPSSSLYVGVLSMVLCVGAPLSAGIDQIAIEPPLPGTIFVGSFALAIESYSSHSWQPNQSRWTGVAGLAEITLTCTGDEVVVAVPFSGLTLTQAGAVVIAGLIDHEPSAPIEIEISGFVLLVDRFRLGPGGAEAEARLQFPDSLVQAGGDSCGAAEVNLGTIDFFPSCRVYRDLPNVPFGPWSVGNTGMVLSGTGVLVDLSFLEAAPSPPYPEFLTFWRGVFLNSGITHPEKGEVVSNTGFLHGEYEFSQGLVLGNGLSTTFESTNSYLYRTLQPYGYRIQYPEATLIMEGSRVTGGTLHNGELRFPTRAVVQENGIGASGTFEALFVQPDLDLYGTLIVEDELFFGELTGADERRFFSYQAPPFPGVAHFFSSGSYRPEFYPLAGDGSFLAPNLGAMPAVLDAQGIQGVTFLPESSAIFRAYTPDTPEGETPPPPTLELPAPIESSPGLAPFLNVAAEGVHGEVYLYTLEALELGPTYRADYDGGTLPGGTEPVPFVATLDSSSEGNLTFRFVDSAVYASNGSGVVAVPGAVGTDLGFTDMNFTSTAELAAAKLQLSVPAELDYWGVALGQVPGASEAGVLHPKSGRIFLTNAFLAETDHYARPFHLTWATIRANGQFGDVTFNYDSSGQKFDGFAHSPSIIGLSEYDPDDTDHAKAFLQTAGTVSFDFFGTYYLDLRDFHPEADGNIEGRHIVLENDGLSGALSSETDIAGDWAGKFGEMGYEIVPDSWDYDGFRGDGLMALVYVGGDLDSSVDLSRDRICLRVLDGVEDGFEDVQLAPASRLTRMRRITGCGCIVDRTLRNVHLQAELEASQDATYTIRSGSYASLELDITPSTTALDLNGSLFLNLGAGLADVEVVGSAGFLVDRDEDFVEGDVNGRFDAATLLGLAGGLHADGQISWHLGAGDGGYSSMQGRVAVGIVAPFALVGTGVEGGFYVGANAPSAEAWVLYDADPRFLDFTLPDRLTGVYGYAKYSKSLNLYVVSGGYELYGGLGLFVGDGFAGGVIGQMRAHVWGKLLGGVLSASAWAQLLLQVDALNPAFKGSMGLEVCALFVLCKDVQLQLELDQNGFDVDY